MEKILLAQDAAKADTGASAFAGYLAAITNSRGAGTLARYTVHKGGRDRVKELIDESRFSDVLIIEPEIFFSANSQATPALFVRNIFKDLECPVIIAPETFEEIEEIVFVYDGTKSSMFAIKQFCYLFPQLDEKKVTLLQVTRDEIVPHNKRENLKEWLSAHYNSIGFVSFAGFGDTGLLTYLSGKENTIFVMCAGSKTTTAGLFAHSYQSSFIKSGQAIFIAHY